MTLRSLILLASILTTFAFNVLGAQPFPQDVQRFLDDAEMCQHFAGEWDSSLPEQNRKNIEKEVNTYCLPAEKALPELRKKYRENSEIMKALADYDF